MVFLSPTRSASPGWIVPVLFTVTIFTSASLLFFVQPLYAKIVLPYIGGAPAVWTTAMLFFQSVLIGGYTYAHFLTRMVPVRAQVSVHMILWAGSLFFLPLAVSQGWFYDASRPAALQTLVLFASGVGLPFAFLSANAPLIQSWYARTGGPSAEDPYFLYGASNLGSLVALLAFPLVAEPLFGARLIGFGFTAGFALLGALLLAAGLSAARQTGPNTVQRSSGMKFAPGRIAYWGVLAFVPSSLMLVITTKISTDVGAIPLVWVIPLSLYLLTFVLTFTDRRYIPPFLEPLLLLVTLLFLTAVFSGLTGGLVRLHSVALMIAAFFVLAMICHRRLYEARPEGASLTLFYVSMSVGGAVGGLFSSILAPLLFSVLFEGSVTVFVAALVLTLGPRAQKPLGVGAMAAWAAVATVGIGTVSYLQSGPGGGALFRDRSFFGVHDVRDILGERIYTNGTTRHGGQDVADLSAERPTPLFYYHRNGPMGQVLTSSLAGADARIGVVGLGVGALSCYAKPDQDWHFYEIDAMVDRIARDPSLFTFMSKCGADMPTHLGDARMVLERQDLKFDILIIDAYSSDSVPAHLTTREAVQIYLDRLAPGGVLLFHISNRYYAIDRPLGRIAESLGLQARIQSYKGSDTDPGDRGSLVAAMARDTASLGPIAEDHRWEVLASDGGRLWTDDYANPLELLFNRDRGYGH